MYDSVKENMIVVSPLQPIRLSHSVCAIRGGLYAVAVAVFSAESFPPSATLAPLTTLLR